MKKYKNPKFRSFQLSAGKEIDGRTNKHDSEIGGEREGKARAQILLRGWMFIFISADKKDCGMRKGGEPQNRRNRAWRES